MAGKTYAGLTAQQIKQFLRDKRALKELYEDEAVLVEPEFQKIHAPHPSARKHSGKGKTLCGTKGIRGQNITCARCLRSMR